MEKYKTIFLLISLIGCGLSYPAFSQYNATIRNVTISSPNAASLGKYGDIPVSYHTGIPSVNIPVYTVHSGPLELPVSLSYHASGLKVQEQASWVGAGWNLNAGGVITRTVVGAPDDKGLQAAFTSKGHFSDYGYNSYIFSPGGATCAAPPTVCPQGRPGMPSNSNAPQDANIQTGIFDGEPDLFFFNFNGYSGKFYFNDDRTPIIVPEQDLKIQPIYTGSDWRGFSGFIINTPDGVQYYFGQNANNDTNIDAVEITYNVTTQNQYNGQGASSAWYLNKIVSADGQFSINLIYQAESYSYYTLSMYPIPAVRNPNIFGYNLEYDLDKNFINGVRLSKILFDNGEVDFYGGDLRTDLSRGTGLPNYTYSGIADQPNTDAAVGARALGSISIKSNNFCKKYIFFYNYFYDNSALTSSYFQTINPQLNLSSDQYRLRLDSVQELSCDNSVAVPPYRFSYIAGTVPRKLSFGIDHWGFYNGVNNNTTLIPTYKIFPTTGQAAAVTTVPGADRDTHWPNSLSGTLQQISYPTGGNTKFDFEPNDVKSNVTTTGRGGIANIAVEKFGQTSTSNYQNFTSNGNAVTIDLSNESTFTVSFNITQAGTTVYSTTLGNNSTYQTVISLPAGDYTATLAFLFGYQPPGGAQAALTQDFVTTTTVNVAVGGLRIRTITNSDGINTQNNTVTSYRYTYNNVAGGSSSGLLFSQPVYVQAIRNDVWGAVNGAKCSSIGCINCLGYTNAAYYQSPSSIRPMASTQGNHIGYGEVYVSQAGNGYTLYRYYGNNGTISHVFDPPIQDVCIRSLSTLCDPGLPNSPAPPDPFDPMRGELAFQGHYNESGQLLQSTTSIPLYQFDSLITPGTISRFFITGYVSASTQVDNSQLDPLNPGPTNGQVPVGVNTFTEYFLQSAKKLRDSIITNTYDPGTGNYITDITATYYGSRYHRQPTQKLTYSSKGEAISTNLVNAFDYRISNFNVPDQLNAYYVNLNGDNAYVGNALAGVTLSPTDPNYYWSRLNIYMNYRYMKAIDRQTYITYRRQNFVDPGNVYTTNHNTAKASADPELKPILELQDEYKNPVIERSSFRNGNLLHAEFSRYGYAANPIGFAYPTSTQLINLAQPSARFNAASVNGNSVSKDSRYAPESSYAWFLGNLQQVTNRDGIANSYIWDYSNQLPIAKVTNATVDQIAYTSFEAGGNGGWTVGSTSRDNTTAITGRSSYALNSDISRSNLSPSTNYLISYWTKNDGPFVIAGTHGIPTKGKTVTLAGGRWTYFEHLVNGLSTISLTGTGYIDELRLYPANAQMTTYTYDPQIGMTSQTDVGNRVTYYEYDALARLKRIRDRDFNILKSFDYQYQAPAGCGSGCYILPMQTFAGSNTIGYPVGVFSINAKLLGNATGPDDYVAKWNSDTGDARIGTLAKGGDPMHFNLSLNAGQIPPTGVTGCRYYQYDLSWTNLDGLTFQNGDYVDFGDGTGFRIPSTPSDTPKVAPPNTVRYGFFDQWDQIWWFIHSYPDSSLKTVTFYHSDDWRTAFIDNGHIPATSLTKLSNLRGNLPQQTSSLGGSCYHQASALSVAAISNWNSISGVAAFFPHCGDGVNACEHLSYTQDFMKNNRGLSAINTTQGAYYAAGYRDSTFKLTRLKTDWNTYFTELQDLEISDEHWNREDLSALTKLNTFMVLAGNRNHSNDPTNNPVIPIPYQVTDNILNQIAAGAGQNVSNGTVRVWSAGGGRSQASNSGVNLLIGKGWRVYIDGVLQTIQ